jgi:hypothetical protein
MLDGIPDDPPTAFCNKASFVWSQVKENLQSVLRNLNGLFDPLHDNVDKH